MKNFYSFKFISSIQKHFLKKILYILMISLRSMTNFSSYLKLGIVPCLTDLFLLLLLISFFQIYRVHRLTVIILPKSWHIHTPIVTCNRHFCFIFVFDLRISPSNVSRNYNRISNLRSFFFLCQYDTWNHIFNKLH